MGYNKNRKYTGKNTRNKDTSKEKINPYDFIPLKEVKKFAPELGSLSGYIETSITPKSTLIIPGEFTGDENNRCYEFYTIDSKYAIPGSTVKGVVRNVYETITNSCLSSVNIDLELDNIYSKECLVEFENNRLVAVYKYDKVDFSNDNRLMTYRFKNKYKDYLCYGINLYHDKRINTYHFDLRGNEESVVFEESERKTYGYIVKDNIKLYNQKESELQKFFEKSIILDEKNRKLFDKLKNERSFMIPAYYTKRDKKIYLSPTQKELRYTLEDLIGSSLSCNDENNLCSACSLFGYVSSESSLNSRVRFTDFIASFKSTSNDRYKEVITLNPHPENGKNYIKNQFGNNPAIAGRKYYLNFDYNKIISKNNDNVISKFKYIDETDNISFHGKIYFENLTNEELNKLIFSIELGNDDIHLHKIGHAKAYGYGSCLVKCEKLYLYNDDLKDLLTAPVKECQINHISYFADNKELDYITKKIKDKVGYSNKFFLDNCKLNK